MCRDPYRSVERESLEDDQAFERAAQRWAKAMADRFYRCRRHKRHFDLVQTIYYQRAINNPEVMA